MQLAVPGLVSSSIDTKLIMNFNIDASYMPILFIYIFALTLFCIGLIIWVYVIDSKKTAEKKAKNDSLLLDQLKLLFKGISGDESLNAEEPIEKSSTTMIKEELALNTPDLHNYKRSYVQNLFNKFIGAAPRELKLESEQANRANYSNNDSAPLTQSIELLIKKLDLMIDKINQEKSQLSTHISTLERELAAEKSETEKIKAVYGVLEEKLKSELEVTIKQYETIIDSTTKANHSAAGNMIMPSTKSVSLLEQPFDEPSQDQNDLNEITASLFDDNAKQDVIRLNKEIETLQIGYEAQSSEYETIVNTMKLQLSDLKTEYDQFMERYQMMSSEKTFIEQAYLAEQVE